MHQQVDKSEPSCLCDRQVWTDIKRIQPREDNRKRKYDQVSGAQSFVPLNALLDLCSRLIALV